MFVLAERQLPLLGVLEQNHRLSVPAPVLTQAHRHAALRHVQPAAKQHESIETFPCTVRLFIISDPLASVCWTSVYKSLLSLFHGYKLHFWIDV